MMIFQSSGVVPLRCGGCNLNRLSYCRFSHGFCVNGIYPIGNTIVWNVDLAIALAFGRKFVLLMVFYASGCTVASS